MKEEILQTFVIGRKYHFAGENSRIRWTYLGNDEKQHIGEDISLKRMPETVFYHNSCPAIEKRFNQYYSMIIGGNQ